MRHVACDQGSPEWYFARRGIPTASEFKRILTQRTMKVSDSSEAYINELVGERFSEMLPEGVENYTSRAMRFGKEREDEARTYFERGGLVAQKCGFCLSDDGRIGCSPDALVYKDGELIAGLELKAPEATEHVRTLRAGVLPDDHRAQVHGSMIVTGLPRWYFLSYHQDFPPLLLSVVRDVYTDRLEEALNEWYLRFENAVLAIETLRG